MKLTGSYEIQLDKNSVWKALNDPEMLKKCIPGCEEFIKNSATSFTATATNKIGPFNATFTGDIELQDLTPPNSYRIVGQGNSPVGFASGEATVQLNENNGITKLTYSVEASVGGKIAQLGSRLIDMTAKKMADIFFGNFSELLSSPEIVEGKKEDAKTISKRVFKLKKINQKFLYTALALVVLIAIYLVK